jgi:hypothetical protein
MLRIDVDNFKKEVTCTFKGETYSVRDNGAVFRHKREGARKRPLDEKWTFGNPSEKRGYMYISSTVVHQIVATAFHGPKPTKDHVVDHIDTNRRNNRPENLRWITRLENLLLNPITRRRIEIAYGSLNDFFENPGQPLHGKLDPNFEWMRSVTKKEGEEAHKRLLDWAKSGKSPSGGRLDEWLYDQKNGQQAQEHEDTILTASQTPGAVQKNWKIPSLFPNCPSSVNEVSLSEYFRKLEEGAIFSQNQYGDSKVISVALLEQSNALFVLCKIPNVVKDWSLAKVTIEDQSFVHENLRSFFTLEGAKKQFTLAQGVEWDGEDTIDDYS